MRRETKLGRKPAKREPLKRIHMVFEGEITEPEYVENFLRTIQTSDKLAVPGEIIRGAGVPITIVDECIRLKEKVDREASRAGFDKLDEVWAIFDVDNHDIPPAIRAARANNIRCVISNPCFEIWGFLHEAPYNRPGNRHEHQRWLRGIIPGYHHEKNPRFDWSWCNDRLVDAIKNAVAGRDAREAEGSFFPHDVPSTNFDRVLASFDRRVQKISTHGPKHLDWWK